MAVQTEGNHISRVAGADLSTKQYFIVKLNASKQVVLAAAGTDESIGVVANTPKSGEVADVYVRNSAGTGKVVAGGAIAVGDALTSDANGKAVVATAAAAGAVPATRVLGFAAEAGALNQVIEFIPAGFARI